MVVVLLIEEELRKVEDQVEIDKELKLNHLILVAVVQQEKNI